jgi:transposase-like protein
MNLIEIMEKFPDQESCIEHLEQARWRDEPECPHCGSEDVARKRENELVGRWNCHTCLSSFNVLSKTMFQKTKNPLQKWFLGIALVMNAKKSLSRCQLGRDLDLHSRTAWYMQVRIRAEMASQESGVFLKGIIEADETSTINSGEVRQREYNRRVDSTIGGKPRKKNKKSDRDDAPKNPRGRGTRKTAIVGA